MMVVSFRLCRPASQRPPIGWVSLQLSLMSIDLTTLRVAIVHYWLLVAAVWWTRSWME